MLAAIAALHLALSQATPPTPAEPRPALETGGSFRAQRPPEGGWAAAEPPPAQASLLSAEPLRGGSAVLAWAGWSSIGLAYAVGVSARDDLGAFDEYDWATSENRLGLLYRRPVARAGSFDVAARLSLAWYVNFGSDYVHEENHSERGLELVPGLSLSRRGGGGVVSLLAEAPMTVTTKYDTGFLFTPRASLAFETPLYPQVTLGVLAGAGYRAGSGDAPLGDGRAELRFLVLAGYQLL